MSPKGFRLCFFRRFSALQYPIILPLRNNFIFNALQNAWFCVPKCCILQANMHGFARQYAAFCKTISITLPFTCALYK